MKVNDPWDSGSPYEPFMGRWSRKIAPSFLDWLSQPAELRWLDVGCGTGALSSLITEISSPREVLGIDPSPAFINYAAHAARDTTHLHFKVAGADKIPAPDYYFDIAVSALALNFFPDPVAGLREMGRVVKPGREIAVYVWDYAEGMQMLRLFWDVAISVDPEALALDEKVRFPLCQPEALATIFGEADLAVGEITSLETPAIFENFDDYWLPFLGGTGPAPGYVASLTLAQQAKLAAALQERLPFKRDGSISLLTRAWSVRAFTRGSPTWPVKL